MTENVQDDNSDKGHSRVSESNRTLMVTLNDDPHQLLEEQRSLLQQERVHSLLLDTRGNTAEEVRQWLDRCRAIPGFLEGSAAEWLIDDVTVLNAEAPQDEQWNIEWIRTEVGQGVYRITSSVSTLTEDDDVSEFLEQQVSLSPEERLRVVVFDARTMGMESIERWIGFFYMACDEVSEDDDSYEPETLVVMSEHEAGAFADMDNVHWIQTVADDEDS